MILRKLCAIVDLAVFSYQKPHSVFSCSQSLMIHWNMIHMTKHATL